MADNLAATFSSQRNSDFSLRMSNVGKPLCQLVMARDGAKRDPIHPTQMPVRFATGNLMEEWFVAVMHAAGIPIEGYQTKAKLDIADTSISGTSDLIIYGKVWDLKTASDFAFKKYERDGYEGMKADDPFGYVGQGFMYAKAHDKPLGGWIIINKSNGKFVVISAPEEQEEEIKEVLENVATSIKYINEGGEFKRGFDDEEEKFRSNPTGNRKLKFGCEWCDYKAACWPDLTHAPAAFSKAKDRKWVYYTELNNTLDE
jgi:hypothetical protein